MFYAAPTLGCGSCGQRAQFFPAFSEPVNRRIGPARRARSAGPWRLPNLESGEASDRSPQTWLVNKIGSICFETRGSMRSACHHGDTVVVQSHAAICRAGKESS
jgi:hypothetical protein